MQFYIKNCKVFLPYFPEVLLLLPAVFVQMRTVACRDPTLPAHVVHPIMHLYTIAEQNLYI